jgi:hypothetical protein
MSLLKNLIASIGHFFENLFKSTQTAFNELPKEQQDAIISGVNISQIIKEGYTKDETALVSEVAEKLSISTDVANGVILHVLNSIPGINVTAIQDGLDKLADSLQSGITDEGWNGLWETVAKAAASWLSTGSISWVTLGLGVVEFAFQLIVKGVK